MAGANKGAKKKKTTPHSAGSLRAVRAKPDVAAAEKARAEESATLADCLDAAFEKMRMAKDKKGLTAKLLRLLQVRKELAGERPPKVTVQWIDNWDEKSNET